MHAEVQARQARLEHRWRLRSDAGSELDGERRLLLSRGEKRYSVGPLEASVAERILSLLDAGASDDDVGGPAAGPPAAQPTAVLTRLRERGWLELTVALDGVPLATLRPTAHAALAYRPQLLPAAEVRLSRFAFLHRDRGQLVLESPRSSAVVVVADHRLGALVAWLATPRPMSEVLEGPCGLPGPAAHALVGLLSAAAVVVELGPGGDSDEDDTRHLAQWSLPDLLFHARSRDGRHANPYGATYPLKGRFGPPERPKPGSGDALELDVPSASAVSSYDPPLSRVLEGRRSWREHEDRAPITVRQLGHFLHRVGAVRTSPTTWSDGSDRPIGTVRPYPTGGALYELEIYPVVRLCQGLEAGIYRYDPFGHRLLVVAGEVSATSDLLDHAKRKTLMSVRPQILIVVAARFGVVMYKYESMAYATTLKNVGVLLQTMYCVATAMRLAPCAVGGGDSDLFSRVAGLDYYDETSVGEFLLGSRPPDAG